MLFSVHRRGNAGGGGGGNDDLKGRGEREGFLGQVSWTWAQGAIVRVASNVYLRPRTRSAQEMGHLSVYRYILHLSAGALPA